MSVDRVSGGWKVRWREGGRTTRARARTFPDRDTAVTFDLKIRRAKNLGTLAVLDAGKMTLSEFVETAWGPRRLVHKAQTTKLSYGNAWAKHIEPHLGDVALAALSAGRVDDFQAALARSVGAPSVRKALAVLSGICQYAVVQGEMASNPVRDVEKIAAPRSRKVRPLGPVEVEKIRRRLDDESALLVSVLAYAGLRPGEALALTWADVKDRTLIVDKAIALGNEKPTKTNKGRTVNLLAPLAADLAAFRLSSGARSGPIFQRDGLPWRDSMYRSWRRNTFQPVAPSVRPYDLRHSFASLLIAQGENVVQIASQLGHRPSMLVDTYAHVVEEFSGRRVDPEAEIRRARGELVVAV